MATHDYVIANGTGSAVRSDLNNALAAIVSNNSSSSEPATKYAYQWWADTTTGQLKLRNSANNGWVTIFELDGTMLMEDGTVSAPGLAFASDLNTGFFRSAADKINFATGGVERLEIGSSEVVFNDGSNDVDFRVESNGNANMLFVDGGNDRVGIQNNAPAYTLHVGDGSAQAMQRIDSNATALLSLKGGTSSECRIEFGDSGDDDIGKIYYDNSTNSMEFSTNASEAARIDSSGRLLVGLTSARATKASASIPSFQIEGTGDSDSRMNIGRNSNADNGPEIHLYKTRGTSLGSNTVVQDDDFLGTIGFYGADGSDLFSRGAEITAAVDGTPGSDDMPTRLTFATCADGAASPSERLRIDSSGHLNLVSSSSTLTNLNFTENALNTYARIEGGKSGSGVGDLRFHTYSGGLSEAARLDSSGRLLVGTSTSTHNIANQSKQAIVITGDLSRGGLDITGYTGGSSTGSCPEINFNRSLGTTDGSVTALSAAPWHLGSINFSGSTGSAFSLGAQIRGVTDSTAYSGSNSGGELRFYTTANGATSTTERMRISSTGRVSMAHDGSYYSSGLSLSVSASDNGTVQVMRNTNASLTNSLIFGYVSRTSNSAFQYIKLAANNASDTDFVLRGDGNAYADGSWNAGGADYAEYFEWSDGNTEAKDRRGISVVLDGNKIREAVAGEEPIGVISGNPSAVGDADIDSWKGKYLRDDYGTYIQEDYEVEDDDGNTVVQQRRQLNPDYNPDTEYVSREDRPEWDCVGLMGKLRIRKGQVTGTRWIKMRDVSDTVEEWLVR